jgi:5-methylcytosine-specific restriction endonuclease McrA
VAHPEKGKQASAQRLKLIRGNSGAEKVTARDLASLFRFQEGRCAYCAVPLGKRKHLDHVVPLSRGGPHALSNLAWSCPRCNNSKGWKVGEEFGVWRECHEEK